MSFCALFSLKVKQEPYRFEQMKIIVLGIVSAAAYIHNQFMIFRLISYVGNHLQIKIILTSSMIPK